MMYEKARAVQRLESRGFSSAPCEQCRLDISSSGANRMVVCDLCREVVYCSQECAVAHSTAHIMECVPPSKEIDLYIMKRDDGFLPAEARIIAADSQECQELRCKLKVYRAVYERNVAKPSWADFVRSPVSTLTYGTAAFLGVLHLFWLQRLMDLRYMKHYMKHSMDEVLHETAALSMDSGTLPSARPDDRRQPRPSHGGTTRETRSSWREDVSELDESEIAAIRKRTLEQSAALEAGNADAAHAQRSMRPRQRAFDASKAYSDESIFKCPSCFAPHAYDLSTCNILTCFNCQKKFCVQCGNALQAGETVHAQCGLY